MYITQFFINQKIIDFIIEENDRENQKDDNVSGSETECDSDYDVPAEMDKLSNLPEYSTSTTTFIESPNVV